jgi:phosphocarrier protein
MLVKAVRPYRLSVEVEAAGEKASGNSVLGLMALGACYGSEVTFTIVGENAFQAMAAVHHLFETHFEDPRRPSAAVAKAPTTLAGVVHTL